MSADEAIVTIKLMRNQRLSQRGDPMSAIPERRAGNWPRLTRVQRELLQYIESRPHGSLAQSPNRTTGRLVYEGMIIGTTIINCYYTITQRGRDYLRFGIRKRSRP